MTKLIPRSSQLLLFAFILSVCPAYGQDDGGILQIPEELLEDEHVREEFGINEFTTPSIRKIFEELKALRPLPYDELKRVVPESIDPDRTRVAVTLGFLIADGFFAVESEQFLDLEPVGLALLDHAKALGAGERIKKHTKSLLDQQNLKDWESLRAQLSRTQQDVEKEMVLIRDTDLAHLIALGGWLRAFEIGCAAAVGEDYYTAEKAAILAKPEYVNYFIVSLETMAPRMQQADAIVEVIAALKEVYEIVDLPEQEVLTEAQINELASKIAPLVDKLYGEKENGE